MTVKHYDLLIAGAGMVGLTLAASLRDSGLRIALIDASRLPGAWQADGELAQHFDARVSALTSASQRLLQKVGAWPFVLQARACAYTHMHVWDAGGTASINFDANDVRQPALGHIVENSVTCAALMKALQGASMVDFYSEDPIESLCHDQQRPKCYQLGLKSGAILSGDLLVAADGANSFLREQAGFDLREWSYEQKAIVATVQMQQSHDLTAWQRFLPEGPLAFLPLADNNKRCCSIVWSADTERAQQLMAMSEADFIEALENGLEKRLGSVESISKRFCFPLRQRHAREYYMPGMALVGDAAHVIHPLAGQGVNLGLGDVQVLHDEILRAQKRGLALGSAAVLSRYQRRRMGDNLAMMAVMEGFKRLFGRRELLAVLLRNTGMRGLDRAAALKRLVIKQAMGF